MKIALFGATGNTGLQLAEQALARGHHVTALVRNPDKLQQFTSNSNFKIVKCNIFNEDELASHLTGQECVLSALGAPGIHIFKVTLYVDTMKSIVAAMRKANIKRMLCVTAFYTKYDQNYPNVYKYVLRAMIGRQLDNMYEMEQYLTNECQDIDYTIVRPPRLLDGPLLSQQEVVNEENGYWFPDLSSLSQIPRANVARFMLDSLENNLYIKKGVAVDMPKPKA